MKLRKIKTEDNQQVKALIQRLLTAVGLALPGSAYFDPQLGQLTEYYERLTNASYWVVVNEQNQVVACGGYGPFPGQAKICELQKLYVAEEAQGQGLSKLLLEKILAEAKKEYRQIYLETTRTLAVANALYQKYGFQELREPLAGSEHEAMDRWYLKTL